MRTATWLRRHGLSLLMALSVLVAAWMPFAVEGQTATPEAQVSAQPLSDFDIPAQPLVDALNQFSMASGRAALFPGTTVNDHRSTAVRGRYTAREALHRLLDGSGLDVEEVGTGKLTALILTAAPAQTRAVVTAVPPGAYALGGYESRVQAHIWEAICANPRTAAGSYRSLLRFQVDANGHLEQPRLLTSTGERRRDAVLLEAVQRIQLDQPPPPQMAQPVTMLILPAQADGPVCAAGG